MTRRWWTSDLVHTNSSATCDCESKKLLSARKRNFGLIDLHHALQRLALRINHRSSAPIETPPSDSGDRNQIDRPKGDKLRKGLLCLGASFVNIAPSRKQVRCVLAPGGTPPINRFKLLTPLAYCTQRRRPDRSFCASNQAVFVNPRIEPGPYTTRRGRPLSR